MEGAPGASRALIWGSPLRQLSQAAQTASYFGFDVCMAISRQL